MPDKNKCLLPYENGSKQIFCAHMPYFCRPGHFSSSKLHSELASWLHVTVTGKGLNYIYGGKQMYHITATDLAR